MPANVLIGNIFDAKEKYIVHQCNCVTNKAAHLSFDIFSRYPYANIYKGREGRDKPGSIIVKGNGKDERYVINLLGQIYPGKPKYPIDDAKARKGFFFSGLQEIAKIKELESVAFPWGIGCGAAGGDWDFYHHLINKFADFIQIPVIIYKLGEWHGRGTRR